MRCKTVASFFFVAVFVFVAGAVSLYAKEDPYKQMAQELSESAKLLSNPKIAILPFSYLDKRKTHAGAIISERLTTRIVKLNKYKVIERQLLENVLQELHFETTGVVDAETTKQLGKVLGVEAIVTGSILDVGEGMAEVNARVIKTDTAEVMATSSVEMPIIWAKEPAPGQAAPYQQAAPERISQPVFSEAPAPSRQVKRSSRMMNTYVDFLTGGGAGKVDLSFKNLSYPLRESDLALDINGSGSLDSVSQYRQVKFTGAELTRAMAPVGLRFIGFGKHWGGGFEMSYFSYVLAKQTMKSAITTNSGTSSGSMRLFVDDYLKIDVLTLLSFDLMFRLSDKIVQPYAGLGLGMTMDFVSSPYIASYNSGVYSTPMSDLGIGLLFRVPLGVRIALGDSLVAFAEYRPTTNYFVYDRTVKKETDEVYMSMNFMLFGLSVKL